MSRYRFLVAVFATFVASSECQAQQTNVTFDTLTQTKDTLDFKLTGKGKITIDKVEKEYLGASFYATDSNGLNYPGFVNADPTPKPGGTSDWTGTVNVPAGVYTVTIKIKYKDANGEEKTKIAGKQQIKVPEGPLPGDGHADTAAANGDLDRSIRDMPAGRLQESIVFIEIRSAVMKSITEVS